MSDVIIHDWGKPIYLDGAEMQFAVYANNECVAYCDTLALARLLANALTCLGGDVIIQTD